MEVDPDKAGMSEARLERVTERFATHYVEPGRIAGCQITVARGGHVAYHRSLGLADREQGIPIAEDTIFRIYSMTKPVASVALMQLYERGLFGLLDPVHRYIPSWRTQKVGTVQADGTVTASSPERPVNVRDLLMHTSGIAGDIFRDNVIDSTFSQARSAAAREAPETLESVTELLGEHPLKFEPGSRWNYGISTDVVPGWSRSSPGCASTNTCSARFSTPWGWWTPASSCPRTATIGWPRATASSRRNPPG